MIGVSFQLTPREKRELEFVARTHRRSQTAAIKWLVEREAERIRQEKKPATQSPAGQPALVIAEE